MSGSLRDFLKIAGVVIVTLALLSILFLGLQKATGFTNKAYSKIDSMSQSVEESDYTRYDGALISGTEVIAAIKYFQQDGAICIEVNNGYTTTNYVCADETLAAPSTAKISDAQNKNDLNKYINPNAKYLGECVRDTANNLIVAVKFTVQGITTP